jgi:hypothetical protein
MQNNENGTVNDVEHLKKAASNIPTTVPHEFESLSENELQKKKNKSVNLSKKQILKIENYIAQKGGSFSDVVSQGIDLFFEALEQGKDRIFDNLQLENPENSILIPISLYTQITGISFVQIQNLEKSNRLTVKTITDNTNTAFKTRYVVITENHPQYFLIKLATLEKTLDNVNKRINRLEGNFD